MCVSFAATRRTYLGLVGRAKRWARVMVTHTASPQRLKAKCLTFMLHEPTKVMGREEFEASKTRVLKVSGSHGSDEWLPSVNRLICKVSEENLSRSSLSSVTSLVFSLFARAT